MVRCCGLDSTAHSELDRAGHSTHSRGTSDREGGGARPSISWLVVPFRHVTPVLRVHTTPSHMVSVFVLRLSLLVTSSHGGTSAFAFLVAWSRWKVFGPLSLASRRTFHQGSGEEGFLHIVIFWDSFLGHMQSQFPRVRVSRGFSTHCRLLTGKCRVVSPGLLR